MADALGHKTIVIDLTVVTKRVIRLDATKIENITLDGIGPATGIICLKEGGTGGNIVWQYGSTGAAQQHVNDGLCVWVSKGLYLAAVTDADITAWTSGVLLIHTY